MLLKEAKKRIYELCKSKGLNTKSLAMFSCVDPSTVCGVLGTRSKSLEVASIIKFGDYIRFYTKALTQCNHVCYNGITENKGGAIYD